MTITITHDRTQGTLVYGGQPGDGSGKILRDAGFRFFHDLPEHPEHGRAFACLPHSRRRRCKSWAVDTAATNLKAAGFAVNVEVDDVTPCQIPFADLEAEKYACADARADRYANRADRAISTGQALHKQVDDELAHIPPGQPHLIGHHSYNRTKRAEERRHAKTRRAIEEMKRGDYWAGRAEAAAAFEAYRRNVPRTLRRIEELEADLRGRRRALDGRTAIWSVEPAEYGPDKGLTLDERLAKHGAVRVRQHADQDGKERGSVEVRIPPSDRAAAVLHADIIELEEEIAYWRSLVAQAERSGVKVWRREDFAKGDFVLYHDTWFEVIRVNKKSLTIPALIASPGRRVLRKEDNTMSWNDRLPYPDVQGRKTAKEIAAMLAETDQTNDQTDQTEPATS